MGGSPMGLFGRSVLCLFLIATMVGCSSTSSQQTSLQVAELQEVPGQVPASTIEIQGLSAGAFNPTYWQNNTLNWVGDVRDPLLPPLTTGPYQNIYSPWPLEQANGWRVFYGGWDGSNTPNDRVYSVDTSDFLNFNNRTLVIDHGVFEHVNNVNVRQLPDGSMHMICTVAPDQNNWNKPAYFSSPNGVTWNGSPQPYLAQMSDIISIPNYPLFQGGDFNGANVLLSDHGAWTLYFSNWNDQGPIGTMYRATTNAPPTFQLQGLALTTGHMVNDIKKLPANGKTWYLMGLHTNMPSVWYSLSNDGVNFDQEQTMFGSAYPDDLYLITLGFVTKNNQVLGVLYGGNTQGALQAQDAIFSRWLQKKVSITDASGVVVRPLGALGPDRQWFPAPSGSLQGNITVYAEDGITPIAKGSVNLSDGKAYQLVLSGGG